MSIRCPNCNCVTFHAKSEVKESGTHLILICTGCKSFVDFDPENQSDKVLTEGNA